MSWREYVEVSAVIAGITVLGWFAPLSYRAFGHVYLLAVIMLCLRVGRGPVLFAAIVSALAWNFVFMPPRLSFSVVHFEDGLLLGTYFAVALIAGQLTARIRAAERAQRQREQRATALFHLTRALAGARNLDEAIESALQEADELLNARTALMLAGDGQALVRHPASSAALSKGARTIADRVWRTPAAASRLADEGSNLESMYVPVVRGDLRFGVFVVTPNPETGSHRQDRRELVEAFGAQIALLIERERLRAAAERQKLLEVSNRLHRTLLDSVSHELRTPLAVLRSAAENLHAKQPERREEITAEIRLATHRLDRLVANLLNQTRLESGAIQPQIDACDVRDLVAAARRNLGEILDRRALSVDIADDLPLAAADALLMEQVLANLLWNAVLHTPPGTPVAVIARHDQPSSRIVLSVVDRGPGLSAELQTHLFEKFQRGKGARAGGIGLGLSIVRGFMLVQSGSVDATNNVDGGACFTLLLPVAAHQTVPIE